MTIAPPLGSTWRARALGLLLATCLCSVARAEDDAPIAYPDDEQDSSAPRKLPRRAEQRDNLRERSDEEELDRPEKLFGLDDPNLGLATEFVIGVNLLDSSAGQGFESSFAWGLRFTWEFGRMLGVESLREALFGDVSWLYSTLHDGTATVFGETHLHDFSIAPAYEFTFGSDSDYGFFFQAGGGMTYQSSAIHYQTAEWTIGGIKPLLQYGIGLRGRPEIHSDPNVRLSFRVELTRFRRGYMDDTFLGGSVGAAF